MNRQAYMEQLKKKLKRLPKEDFERAVEYYEEYFAEAGEENEAKAIEDLGSPQEAADQIICDMALDYSKEPVKNVKKGLDALWVIILALCAAPIALPLLFAGVILALAMMVAVLALLWAGLLVAASATISGPVILIAGFTVLTKSFPVFLSCSGVGLAAVGIGAICTYGMYRVCKGALSCMIRMFGKLIRKGGEKNA